MRLLRRRKQVVVRQIIDPNKFKLVGAFNAEMERIGRPDLKLGLFDHSECGPDCPYKDMGKS